MDHCTIYSHQIFYDELVQLVKNDFESKAIQYAEKDGVKVIEISEKGSFFKKKRTLSLHYRERKYPSYQLVDAPCDLTQNLVGMLEFVGSIKARNTDVHQLLMQKIEIINCELSFSAHPAYSDEMKTLLNTICESYDPFIFAEPGNFFNKSKLQHFLNSQLDLILDTRGNSEIKDLSIEIDSSYFDESVKVTDSAIRRKEASIALLKAKDIPVNPHLPVIHEDITLRNKAVIISRCYSLAIMAAKGQSAPKEQINQIIEHFEIEEFSEKELIVLEKEELTEQEKADATWRYEALNVLLWALGKVQSLPYPSSICAAQEMAQLLFDADRESFSENCEVRSKEEILDQLDLIYRMNWACVDARQGSKQPEGGLNPSVVFERHYALNWLINYQNQKWDEVSTDT